MENGRFLAEDDSRCLLHTARLGLTLVTYDRRIIPPLLKIWAEAGREHGGAIFVDENAISSAHTGHGIRALHSLCRAGGKWDRTDRVCFLRR
jgi:hypothetical protein